MTNIGTDNQINYNSALAPQACLAHSAQWDTQQNGCSGKVNFLHYHSLVKYVYHNPLNYYLNQPNLKDCKQPFVLA